MLAPLSLFPSPQVQPALGRALSEEFVENLGMPGDLWLPMGDERAYSWGINQSHGTLNSGVTTTGDGAGVFGRSWKFDGATGTSIQMADAAGLRQLTPAIIIAFTPATVPTGNYTFLCNKQRSATATSYGLWMSSAGKLYLETDDASVHSLTGTTTLVAGSTYIVVAGYDGAQQRIYLNGVPEASSALSVAIQFGAFPLFVGNGPFANNPFTGKIHLFGLLGSFPSAAQVSALYSSLLYGEPYRMFEPSVMERMYATALPINLSPGAADINATVVAPSLSLGPISAAAGIADLTADLLNPSISLGAVVAPAGAADVAVAAENATPVAAQNTIEIWQPEARGTVWTVQE